jgi:WhiB family redox-sensing transcriptional regulator
MCLALAMRRNEPHGIFGGLDETERAQLRRKHRRTARTGAAA